MTFGRSNPAEQRARREAERAANLQALMTPSRAVCRGNYAGSTTSAAPKTEPKRNRTLLAMANGRQCLLRVPLVCTGGTATTVACHSNQSIHGKAGARKADDDYSVWGCSACHSWLDQGPAPAAAAALAFTLAHIDQVLEWRRIAADPKEPPRFRAAARWALNQLHAKGTP